MTSEITAKVEAAVEEAAAKIGRSFGLEVEVVARRREDGASFHIGFRSEAASKAAFARYAGMFGLATEDYGKQIVYRRNVYKLVGLVPGRSRYPIQADRVPDGRKFKLPEEALNGIRGGAR